MPDMSYAPITPPTGEPRRRPFMFGVVLACLGIPLLPLSFFELSHPWSVIQNGLSPRAVDL
jgi:hypothetical protein